MNTSIQFLAAALMLTGGAGAVGAHAAPMLVEYDFLCPSCEDERSISIRYAADGTSILQTHNRADTPQIAPAHDDSEYLPGEWIAGPMTRFRPGRIQHWDDEIGTNFIEVQKAPVPDVGTRYADRRLTPAAEQPGRESWSIGAIRVSVEDGEDDRVIRGLEADHKRAVVACTRTEYGADGAETGSEETALAFDLWMADALPFSPLPFQYEPFLGNRVPPYNRGPVGNRLIAELLPHLAGMGGLVRAEITAEGTTSAIEVRSVQATPEPPMHKYTSLPVVSGEQVGQFAGPLFLASLLRGGMIQQESDATLTLDGRALQAVSAWKTNEAGDLVIVISAREENTSVFLVRPVNGIPAPGAYDTTSKVDYRRLRGMSEDELADHTRRFQLYGVATDQVLPTVLTGIEQGTVTIRETEGDTLAGSVSGRVSALPTDSLSDMRAMPVELTFRAEPGLDEFRFRSDESRVAR